MTASRPPTPRFGQPTSVRTVVRHAFAVGETVKVLPSTLGRRPKDIEKSLYANTFTVTRLLPEEASIFQYRIKNTHTGQERVASESELSAVTPDGQTPAN